MAEIIWTPEQRQIIEYGGGSMLVSASAGSGKTTVMLERVIWLIKQGYSLRHMLISTFTVAAADDMREKLFNRLTAEYEKTGDKRYLGETDALSSADIGTLDSWCQRLVKRYFYITGDDPAFTVADETECAAWRKFALTRAIEEAADDPSSGYIELSALFNKRRSDDNVRSMAEIMMNFAATQSDSEAWLTTAAHAYGEEKAKELLTNYADALYNGIMYGVQMVREEAKYFKIDDKAGPLIDEIVGSADYVKSGGTDELERWTVARGVTQIRDGIIRLRVMVKGYEAFMRQMRSARNDVAERCVGVITAIAAKAAVYYAAAKAEKCKLDFNDLERKAKIILTSDEAPALRARYTHVFIDEYQDINPLQENIIELVGNNNLFFVGDIKQSIYAFRNCTPEAFAIKRDRLSEAGGMVRLNKNYRSADGILAFCNSVFSEIMTYPFGGVDYKNTSCFPIEGDGNDGSVEIYSYSAASRDNSKTDFDSVYSVKEHEFSERESSTGNEADAVTGKIVDLLSRGGYKYDDIAVLVRSRSNINLLINNLRAVGIPVSVSSKLKVEKGRCNSYLLAWLKIVDNFRDDVSLATVMRSPSVGFTDGEMIALRAKHPHTEYFCDCVLAERTDAKVAAFLETVGEYARLSKTLTAGELAGRITSEQRLFATALSEEQGIAKADGLGLLAESVTGYSGTLSEYLHMLTESEAEIDVPSRAGSVRIMTVHAAKGLEFPVVLTYGLSRRFRTDYSAPYIADGEFGFALESRLAESGETVPSLPLMAARLNRDKVQLEEEMRILYVMLTRAREKMVIFLPDNAREKMPKEATSFVDWIYPAALLHGITEYEDRAASVPSPEAEEPKEEDVARMAEGIRPLPAADIAEIKKSVTDILTEEYDEYVPTGVLIGDYSEAADRGEAMQRGTAYHVVLEQLDFGAPFDEQIGGIAEAADFGEEDIDKLRAAHAAISAETRGAKVYREQPFIFESDRGTNGESDGMILQGVIDLLIIRDGECEIVDYKTGALTETRRDKYLRQLDIYAAATEKILHLPVRKKRIYLIDAGKFM